MWSRRLFVGLPSVHVIPAAIRWPSFCRQYLSYHTRPMLKLIATFHVLDGLAAHGLCHLALWVADSRIPSLNVMISQNNQEGFIHLINRNMHLSWSVSKHCGQWVCKLSHWVRYNSCRPIPGLSVAAHPMAFIRENVRSNADGRCQKVKVM